MERRWRERRLHGDGATEAEAGQQLPLRTRARRTGRQVDGLPPSEANPRWGRTSPRGEKRREIRGYGEAGQLHHQMGKLTSRPALCSVTFQPLCITFGDAPLRILLISC